MTIKPILTTALMVVGLAAGTAAVHAEDYAGPMSKVVTYDDLNLDSDKGVATLYSRVKNAAHSVCAPLESRDLSRAARYQSCYGSAVTAAVTQVNNSKLSALFDESTKSSTTARFASLR